MAKTTKDKEISKAYNPRDVEQRLYRFWEDGGFFTPEIDPAREPFTIIMPPPNVSGDLHLGSVIFVTLEDILTRWHRMLGEPTLWLPGEDHAAIATQNVVERELAAEGVSRHDLGREKFLERVAVWVDEYRGKIREQLKRLGSSCDWTRERFTLDPGPARAVRQTFVNLYNDGLIYRGERIANWCPRCQTALSDLEVEHHEVQGHLWYVRYPLLDDAGRETGDYITIATTRPETILADVAVSVSPGDARYEEIVGRTALLPIVGRHIPVIADELVDPAFGTGALKITPGHDAVDFDIGQRHGLETIMCVGPDAKMTKEGAPYEGMDRFECRDAIVKDLKERGYLVKTEPYVHSVGHCQRCHTMIEPLVSKQWFVRMEPLSKPAIEAVTDGRIRFVPERFTRVYLNWMENIRDWCISRQLWFGHPIPVWYCRDCEGQTVTVDDPEVCQHCGSSRIERDPDVLDTWFSSALWPHSTLGWPEDTPDLRYFYPTSVMETGYDIIFFWVARMIMMGFYNMKEIPFRWVFLHGLVRDERGEKISKSKITAGRHYIASPVEAVEAYGADAVRYSLVTGSTPGNDLRISEQRMEAGRNFANKLWNAARFVIGRLDDEKLSPPAPAERAGMPLEDRWIMSRLNRLVANASQLMNDFQFGIAAREINDFLWGEYCDWYLEMSKVRLAADDRSPLPVLVHVLDAALRLLHPYMPFVTEEIWQALRPHLAEERAEALIIAPFPVARPEWLDEEAERQAEAVIEAIRAVRNIRAEHRVEPARFVEAYIIGSSSEGRGSIEASRLLIVALARARPLHIVSRADEAPREAVVTAVLKDAQVVLPMAGLFDVEAERSRLGRQIAQAEGEVERLRTRLANEEFTAKAPATVVQKEREKLEKAEGRLEGLRRRLRELGSPAR
ncbi:MAG: valine--tRNA ligase [Dehalococcoidia bacterium]|nr:valine--tRNA ligase [Dehalococcoidia bacterium]